MNHIQTRTLEVLKGVINNATASVAERLFSTDSDLETRNEWAARSALTVAKGLGFTERGGSDYSTKNIFQNLITAGWIRDIDLTKTQDLFAVDNSVYSEIKPLSSTQVHATALTALHDAILRQLIFLPCDVWHEWQMSLGPRHSMEFNGIWVPEDIEPGGLKVIRMDQTRASSNSNFKIGGVKLDAWHSIARGRALVTRIVMESGVVICTNIPEFGKGLHEFSTEQVNCQSTLATAMMFVSMMKRYGIITAFTDLTDAIDSDDLGFGSDPDQLKSLDGVLVDKFDPSHITSRSMVRNAGPGLYADLSLCSSLFNVEFIPLARDRQALVLYDFTPEPAPEDIEDLSDYHLQDVLTKDRSAGVYYDVSGKPSGVFYGVPSRLACSLFTRGLISMTYAHTLSLHSQEMVIYKTGPVHTQQLLSNPGVVAELYKQWW